MKKQINRSALNSLKSPVWLIAGSVLFVSLIVLLLIGLDVHQHMVKLLQWVELQGAWAAAMFVLLMAAAVVLLLPGILFTTGAGFVFGVVEGTLYVVIGTTIGAAVAFLAARHLFSERAARYIVANSNLDILNRELTRHDWKIVMFTRLIPFFPGKLSNYFFGLTSFSFRGYLLGSLTGFIPFSLHNVYLGSIAADLAALSERQIARTPQEWLLYGAGFLVTVAAVIYLNRLARRTLADYSQGPVLKEDSP